MLPRLPTIRELAITYALIVDKVAVFVASYLINCAEKCMCMTQPVANVIIEVLKKVGCTCHNFSKFQTEIDPQALRKILSDSKITRIVLHASAKGIPAEQVALEIKKTRQLEITFA